MRVCMCFLILLFLLQAAPLLALEASDAPDAKPLAVGATFPDLSLHGAVTPEQRASLGLQGAAPYALRDIKAKTVLLMVFSMYCPHCQKEAPTVNALNALIQENKLDICVIGLGAGNSDFEVQAFQKKYGTTFPLFSDQDFSCHKAIGEVGTPFFYVLTQKSKSKERIVVQTHLGRIASPEKFLDTIVKETKE